jgi:CRISPR/Cas system-associated protein endoribonuclease Cas2
MKSYELLKQVGFEVLNTTMAIKREDKSIRKFRPKFLKRAYNVEDVSIDCKTILNRILKSDGLYVHKRLENGTCGGLL